MLIVFPCARREQSLIIKSTSHAVLASHTLEGACLGSLNVFFLILFNSELVCELHYVRVGAVCVQMEGTYM